MKIIVGNCFHWAGYHLIDLLLENGNQVIGVDQLDTQKKEHLAMFVARNNLFTLSENSEDNGDGFIQLVENGDKLFLKLSSANKVKSKVYLPFLIGEWMPKHNIDKLIETKTSQNAEDILYVRNVMSVLVQWMEKGACIPPIINICSPGSNLVGKKLEKNVFLRDNRSIYNYIDKVLEHYQIYRDFY